MDKNEKIIIEDISHIIKESEGREKNNFRTVIKYFVIN